MRRDNQRGRGSSSGVARTMASPVIAVVMGVSGSGKSTVAALLSVALGYQFEEGDDLHPRENIDKMHGGTALTDSDRLPWLEAIAAKIDSWRALGQSGVITCSALKRSYRDIIIGDRADVVLVYLRGSRELIGRRMAARHEHFMPLALLADQFANLQEPAADERPIIVDVGDRPADITCDIVRRLEQRRQDARSRLPLHAGSGTTRCCDLKLEILGDPDALSCRVAEWLLELSTRGGPERDFAVALSGGSTPRQLYERLVSATYIDRFPWSRTHWFWGDERFVPHGDVLSNYRMVREAMLSRAPIPDGNIHPIPTEGINPSDAAGAYEHELRSFYRADTFDPARPLFDVALLGLGLDGHTASLFPGTPVLDERRNWVAAVTGVKQEPRITLTFPALESCRHAAFLVAGTEKREILGKLCRGDQSLPAAGLRPAGSLTVFADAAAGGGTRTQKEVLNEESAV